MNKELLYQDDISNKFWNIAASGNSFTVTYGKTGTQGQSQTKTFESEEKCLKEAQKIIAEKLKKGYSEDGEPSGAVPKAITAKKSDQATLLAEYDELVKQANIQGLLPFLQTKVKGHTEAMKKNIRKAKRHWMTWVDLTKEKNFIKKGGNQYGIRGSKAQQNIIALSAIALFNRAEINSWDELLDVFNEMNDPYSTAIIEWAKPNWIVDFLLEKTARDDWRTVDYAVLRLWEDKGIIDYNPELFARMLSRRRWGNADDRYENFDKFSAYIINDATIVKRDVLELFNYPTTLHQQFFHDPDPKKREEIIIWERILKTLLQDKKIDMLWFLEKSIQIQTKEWSLNLKSFFRKRILEADPTPEQLVTLQNTIFPLLHASVSAVVVLGIDLSKKIIEEKKFDTTAFLEWLEPVMMREDCKGAIKSILILFDKIAKKQPKLKARLSHLASDVFMIPDLSLQERAVKTIEKLGNAKDAVLKEKLEMYASQMQGNVKVQLTPFLDAETVLLQGFELEDYVVVKQKNKVLLEQNTVILPADWNAILFQFGKFISSTEVIDAEIILHSLTLQSDLFPEDYKEQLQPYLKQLEKSYFEADYKNIFKNFFSEKIKDLSGTFKVKSAYISNSKTINSLLEVLNEVEYKIKNKSKLPLLSFPSHLPHWVAPKVLVERLLQYQEANEPINKIDFAIAISRMPRENTTEALQLCDQLKDEVADLLRYCLGETKEITLRKNSFFSKIMMHTLNTTKETVNNAYWALAARTFDPLGTFAEFETTTLKDIPYVVSPYYPEIKIKEQWQEWRDYKTNEKMRNQLPSILDVKLNAFQQTPEVLLYSIDAYDKTGYFSYLIEAEENVWYWHSLMPQNDDPLALSILKYACKSPDESNNGLRAFLYVMMLPEFWFTDHSIMVLACGLFEQKKQNRLLAGEVLIDLITKQKIDVDTMGRKAGFLISENYGPLQRFTEAITMSKDISPLHNSALKSLLDSCLENLKIGDKLPTNFKKLLELYFDVLTKTGHKPSAGALNLITSLGSNASIKAIVKQISNN
ncbi:DUF6493 family protein [Flavobacterium sp. '19STA2R22 D10 B1']|uniref:DUF6493 family protein n=1 Tax=Flavobacterium aerium TaxID=3037261 RepID=UPI00278BAFFA|nr:DUF6493 family protein [Flavobacterium sp. '19STA2R22 D10 B1']